MKVELEIFGLDSGRSETIVVSPDGSIYDDTQGIMLREVRVPYERRKPNGKTVPTVVRATLYANQDEVDDCCEYWLQMGHDPEVRALVRRGRCERVGDADHSRRGFFVDWRNKEESLFPLFQATMSHSVLYLRAVEYNEDGDPECDRVVLSVPVYVDPPESKKRRYLDMVGAMRSMPQFFLDDLSGQMLLSGFTLKWQDGYSSYNDPSYELEGVNALYNKLEKLLAMAVNKPQKASGLVRNRVDAGRVRHCTGHARRRLEKKQDGLNSGFKMLLLQKRQGYATRAHCVIRFFLQRLIDRCDDIARDFDAQVLSIRHSIARSKEIYGGAKRDPAYVGSVQPRLANIRSLQAESAKARCVRSHISRLMQLEILSKAESTLRVFDVLASEFSSDPVYAEIYRLIFDFERKGFYWKGRKSAVNKMLDTSSADPRFSDKRDEESEKWSRKFAMVYEYWCYCHLVKAFLDCGYRLDARTPPSPKDGSVCMFEKDDLEVELRHGIYATVGEHVRESDDFWLDNSVKIEIKNAAEKREYDELARERTPDFALIFRNKRTSKCSWIVLDAKSQDRMKFKEMILKRERYLHVLHYRVPTGVVGSEMPGQAWLIYAGEEEGEGVCGVECPPVASPNLSADKGQVDPCAGSSAYSFSVSEGIIKKPGVDRVRGHIHANVTNLVPSCSPFVDFVEAQTVTMLRDLA